MHTEWLASIIILVVAAVTLLARRLQVADPILLVIAGGIVAFIPGLPIIKIDPNVLLLAVLPPLLFWHAFIVTPRDIKANAAAIGLTSMVLVALTAFVVGFTLHEVAGLPWAVSIAIGAIVGPTDPVAFLTVARRLGVSPRLMGLLDGENLINDFTALVIYLAALDAVLTGSFSTTGAAGQFVTSAIGGLVIGYVVGRVISFINCHVEDPSVAAIITLCGAYLAFLPAEGLHVSAVLAAGVAGRVAGSRSATVDSPRTRLGGYGFWNTWIFLLTAILFVLVGLQLPRVIANTPTDFDIYFASAAVVIAVIGTRLLFFLLIGLGISPIARGMRIDGKRWPWADAFVAGWSGMRGALSLVLALSLPLDFPHRDVALLTTYAVILITLVLQGTSIPLLINCLPIERDTLTDKEMKLARQTASSAALRQLDVWETGGEISPSDIDRLRAYYQDQGETDGSGSAVRTIERRLISAERKAVIALRQSGQISDDVLRDIEHELDMRDVLAEEAQKA